MLVWILMALWVERRFRAVRGVLVDVFVLSVTLFVQWYLRMFKAQQNKVLRFPTLTSFLRRRSPLLAASLRT